jgi:hypothetical protein
MSEVNLERLSEIFADKRYTRTRRETKEAYAQRVSSVMYRGWAFLGGTVEQQEARTKQIFDLLP